MASPSVHTISKLYFSFFQLKRMKLFTFYIGISAGLSQTIIGKDLQEIFLKGENLSFRSRIGHFDMILSGEARTRSGDVRRSLTGMNAGLICA